MRKIIDGLIQAIKNDEKLTQLATELTGVARQMRESHQMMEQSIHQLDKRLVKLETLVEITQFQNNPKRLDN